MKYSRFKFGWLLDLSHHTRLTSEMLEKKISEIEVEKITTEIQKDIQPNIEIQIIVNSPFAFSYQIVNPLVFFQCFNHVIKRHKTR